MVLLEGNQVNSLWDDNIHGASSLNTAFRNALSGNDDQGGKSLYQWAVFFEATARANNIVGNILGDSTVSMIYSMPFGTSDQHTPAIYNLGYGSGVADDPNAVSSLLRWGNYDTVHGATQWNASEVPTTGIPRINGNAVPATQNLPNSFFLSSQ